MFRFAPALLALGLIVPGAIPAPPQKGPPAGLPLTDQLGVMLQVDNLLDAYREQDRVNEFAGEVGRQFELVQRSGAKWVRAGILWNQIEPKQGKYDWDQVEAVLHAAKQHKIQLVWLVGGTPVWNSRSGPEGLPKQLPDPHFRQFLKHMLERYGGAKDPAHPLRGSIQYWEIINEPNYRWKPDDYATMLTEAHDVLSRDENARIVFGGLGGDILGRSKDVLEGNQVAYFEKVVQHWPKGKRPFHYANFHMYGNDADRFFDTDDAILKYFTKCQDEIRKAMKRNDVDVPVWSTEFDYPSAVKHQVRGRFKGTSAEDGLTKQALFVTEWFPKIWDDQPDRKIFWASLVDDFNDQGAFLSTGLCRWKSDKRRHDAGAHKPAYDALTQLIKSGR